MVKDWVLLRQFTIHFSSESVALINVIHHYYIFKSYDFVTLPILINTSYSYIYCNSIYFPYFWLQKYPYSYSMIVPTIKSISFSIFISFNLIQLSIISELNLVFIIIPTNVFNLNSMQISNTYCSFIYSTILYYGLHFKISKKLPIWCYLFLIVEYTKPIQLT